MCFCENCVHYEMCQWHEPMIPDNIITFFPHNEDCSLFKNKADYVEVVRCKDCGMSRETEDERYVFCMQFADTVDCQAFCSYGERKDT